MRVDDAVPDAENFANSMEFFLILELDVGLNLGIVKLKVSLIGLEFSF